MMVEVGGYGYHYGLDGYDTRDDLLCIVLSYPICVATDSEVRLLNRQLSSKEGDIKCFYSFPLDDGCALGWAMTLSYIEGGGHHWFSQEVQCALYPSTREEGLRHVVGCGAKQGAALDAVAWAMNHAHELGCPSKVRRGLAVEGHG